MIDLKEPARPVYTPEEERLLRDKFILLLHTFLLIYLGLHNLLIPLVKNLFQGELWWTDVHYWFLAQLPLHYLLRKRKEVPHLYFVFLVVGSLTRLVSEGVMLTSFKSWTLFSVVLSEAATFLFLFVLRPQIHCVPKWKPLLSTGLLAMLVPLSFSQLELRSERPMMPSSFKRTAVKPTDSARLGCSGSGLSLSFPIQSRPGTVSRVQLKDCGFAQGFVGSTRNLSVLNSLPYHVNLRLYKLKTSERRVSWKFQRLVQVKSGEEWKLNSYLKDDALYLVKSPERRALGHVVLLPEKLKELSLGTGKLTLDYDSIKWSEGEE